MTHETKSGGPGTVVPALIVSPSTDPGSVEPDKVPTPEVETDEELRERIITLLNKPLTKEEIVQCKVDANDVPGGYGGNLILRPRGKRTDKDPAHTPSMQIIMKGFDTHIDDMKVERTDGTERKIRFSEGHLLPMHTRSFAVLRYLLNHNKFGIHWTLDPKDSGGLWRFLGWVTVEQIPMQKLAVDTQRLMAGQRKVG